MAIATGTAPAAAAALAGEAVPARVGLPPGPDIPAFVQTVVWALAPTWLLDRCARKIGDAFTVTFWPSGLKLAMFSNPDDVKTVFTAPADVAPSATGNTPLAPVLGSRSVLTLTGPEHMRQRKLLLPPFHGERMREYEQTIEEATRHDMAGWALGRPMRLHAHTRAITLEVILRAVFGVQQERMEPLKEAIRGLFESQQLLLVLRAVFTRPDGRRPSGAIGRALAHLDELIYEEIARARAAGEEQGRSDILALLLRARDEDGEALTDVELRDELVTLLLAGHETTATSVAWALERLVRHPDKLERLTAEIDAGDEEYLMAVVNETLRVRPVVPAVVRELAQELQVGAYRMPAGTRVVPSIYLVNRWPGRYEHASSFRPERFLGSSPETFSWIPFGGGIRRCIGASFAQMEMKVMLRTMLAELSPSLPGDWRSRRDERIHRRAITLVPARGARVVWRRRDPSRSAH